MTDIQTLIATAQDRLAIEATQTFEWHGRGKFEDLNNMLGELRDRVALLTGDDDLTIVLPTAVIEADTENLDPFSRRRKYDPANNADYLAAQGANIALLKAALVEVAP